MDENLNLFLADENTPREDVERAEAWGEEVEERELKRFERHERQRLHGRIEDGRRRVRDVARRI